MRTLKDFEEDAFDDVQRAGKLLGDGGLVIAWALHLGLERGFAKLAKSIDRLGTESNEQPGAIEAIAMALGGKGLEGSVSESLDRLSYAVKCLGVGTDNCISPAEILAQALIGGTESGERNVSLSLDGVASAIESLATAVEEKK